MKRFSHSSYLVVGASLLLSLALAACGGGASSATAIPTSTQIPTYNFSSPTPVTIIETAVATKSAATPTAESTSEATIDVASVTLDPEVVARGKGRYDALQCASCHGEKGEGTDKGSSLLTYAQSEGDFIAFMRSGGTIGTSHQYSTNRLSITGGTALYQYVLSLHQSS